MKTGFDITGENSQSDAYMKAMLNIITPVLEKGMVLAAQYSKACGRDAILMQDVEYAMKYCAMNEVGKKIGTHFPGLYDDDEEEDIEIIEESDGDFTRYSGDDQFMNKINEAYDSWDSWVPTNPTEELIKNAIDSNGR
jgi:histone H3/H4